MDRKPTTTGTDIFKRVENAINEKTSDKKNLKCSTTNGGKKRVKNKGLVALVPKAVKYDECSKSVPIRLFRETWKKIENIG